MGPLGQMCLLVVKWPNITLRVLGKETNGVKTLKFPQCVITRSPITILIIDKHIREHNSYCLHNTWISNPSYLIKIDI